jgi:copper chaperone CopZ
MKTSMKIAKLTAATDSAHVEKALEAVPKVRSVALDLSRHQVTVEHEGADEDELRNAVKQLGYIATIE